jgi:hypothetical protein
MSADERPRAKKASSPVMPGYGRRLLKKVHGSIATARVDWKEFAWDVVVDAGVILGATAGIRYLWNKSMPKVASAGGEDTGFFNTLDYSTTLYLLIMIWAIAALILPFFGPLRL